MVSYLSQSSHIGLSYFVMGCKFVKQGRPIRLLVINTSSFPDEGEWDLHGAILIVL